MPSGALPSHSQVTQGYTNGIVIFKTALKTLSLLIGASMPIIVNVQLSCRPCWPLGLSHSQCASWTHRHRSGGAGSRQTATRLPARCTQPCSFLRKRGLGQHTHCVWSLSSYRPPLCCPSPSLSCGGMTYIRSRCNVSVCKCCIHCVYTLLAVTLSPLLVLSAQELHISETVFVSAGFPSVSG